MWYANAHMIRHQNLSLDVKPIVKNIFKSNNSILIPTYFTNLEEVIAVLAKHLHKHCYYQGKSIYPFGVTLGKSVNPTLILWEISKIPNVKLQVIQNNLIVKVL